jgi:hypothetical protein
MGWAVGQVKAHTPQPDFGPACSYPAENPTAANIPTVGDRCQMPEPKILRRRWVSRACARGQGPTDAPPTVYPLPAYVQLAWLGGLPSLPAKHAISYEGRNRYRRCARPRGVGVDFRGRPGGPHKAVSHGRFDPRTSAVIPAFTLPGRVGHATISRCKSGSAAMVSPENAAHFAALSGPTPVLPGVFGPCSIPLGGICKALHSKALCISW